MDIIHAVRDDRWWAIYAAVLGGFAAAKCRDSLPMEGMVYVASDWADCARALAKAMGAADADGRGASFQCDMDPDHG